MSEYENISVKRGTKRRLEGLADGREKWDETLNRLADDCETLSKIPKSIVQNYSKTKKLEVPAR
jgi:hypothetical protein